MPQPELPEEWRAVPHTGGLYEVSTLGRVRCWINKRQVRQPEPHLLQPSVGKNGYRVFCHRLQGVETRLTVHRVVCEVFHGPPPDSGQRVEVRHLDNNKLNNAASNLCWGTAAENAADRVRAGTTNRGERCPFAKLKEDDVVAIRALHADKWLSVDELAQEFGVARISIQRIISGRTWKEVAR